MTDLERFFRRLVANLADSDPARLHRPIPLEDVHQSIVPYRTNRRALGLDSSEDYELVLLRLCAGEGSLVRTEPEEVAVRFAEELQGTNPDLGVLHQEEHVVISLQPGALARALEPDIDPHLAYSPPASPPAPPGPGGLDWLVPAGELDDPDVADREVQEEADAADIAPEAHTTAPLDSPAALPHCLYCGDRLPAGRPVRFCPHCGQRQAPPECPRCHGEVEPGWRHCVNCGTSLAER